MTPQRILITDLDHGARRVELRCGCLRLGRITAQWEPLDATVEELRAEHRKLAPACQHPALGLAAEVKP